MRPKPSPMDYSRMRPKKGNGSRRNIPRNGAEVLTVIRSHGPPAPGSWTVWARRAGKEIVTGIARARSYAGLFNALKSRLVSRPGRGIALAVPLSGVSAAISGRLDLRPQPQSRIQHQTPPKGGATPCQAQPPRTDRRRHRRRL